MNVTSEFVSVFSFFFFSFFFSFVHEICSPKMLEKAHTNHTISKVLPKYIKYVILIEH